MTRGMLLTVALVALGCGPAQSTSVPVKGADVSVVLLAGKWVGTYEGTDSGRKGIVQFDLSAGQTYAEGKVIMNADVPGGATTLPIKFVEAVEKGKVKGVLGPYEEPQLLEPQLKVQVTSEFIGTRQGDVISGTFTTRVVGSEGKAHTGVWRVTKQR
jgi:hypothetical protein